MMEKVKELEGKVVAVYLSYPHTRFVTGKFQRQVARCHCPSKRVRKYLAEIGRLALREEIESTWRL